MMSIVRHFIKLVGNSEPCSMSRIASKRLWCSAGSRVRWQYQIRWCYRRILPMTKDTLYEIGAHIWLDVRLRGWSKFWSTKRSIN